MEPPSADFVPGMGLGATKEATRWAYIGYSREKQALVEQSLAKPRGRPKKSKLESVDAFRAFSLWKIAKTSFDRHRHEITVLELVNCASKIEDYLDVPIAERAFPPGGDFSSSVSRGKKILEIDDCWNSALCEKIDAI